MKLTLLAAVAAFAALPALAHDGVLIIDPYARVIGPAGAVYFRIGSHEDAEDTLISAASPDAGMVMLMTSKADANGVMQMQTVTEGFTVAAGAERVIATDGDHVMLMDLTRPIKDGDTVTLVLTFKTAGEVTVTVPVDNKRKEAPGTGPTEHDAKSGG